MGAENGNGKREFQLRAGAGFCVINIVLIRYLNSYETAWFDQLRMIEMDRLGMKCVGFQGRVVCMSSYYESFCDVLCWFRKEVSSRTPCCISWPRLRSWLFRPFPIERSLEQLWWAMVSIVRQQFLAVAKNEEFGIINFVARYYEKSASRNASLKKKKHFREEIYWKRVI